MVTAREELQEGLELITPVAALFISCYNLQGRREASCGSSDILA